MSAATELRGILDSYFESREIRDFDELKEKCTAVLKKYCDFLVVFREQRYFETDTTDEDLYFQFFSFGYKSDVGKLRFSSRDLLIEEIGAWLSNSDQYFSKYCQVYMRNFTIEEDEREKVFNLIKRIVVFYYLNSGSKAHFLASVSQRMTKSFWRSDVGDRLYTREAAISFLCDRLEIDAALYAVVDELPGADTPVLDCLAYIDGSLNFDDGRIHISLGELSSVSDDAKKSIGRRNRTTGTFEKIAYGISTISGNHVYVDDNDEVKNHSITPEYLIVFSGERVPLSVDKIEIATAFLNSVIRTIVEFEEVHVRKELETSCRELERELGENPLATRDEFERRYISLIAQHFQNDFAVVGLFPMCLRLFRPASNTLQRVFCTVSQEDLELVHEKISIGDPRAACARSFREDETISLWSESKIKRRRELISAGYKSFSNEFELQLEAVGVLANLVDQTGHALVAVPVRINDIIVGTLEFSSPSRSDLQSYTEACEDFADQCGEIYRRLELANDRGWLVRMHFLHAARHRLQHIVDRISEHSKELSDDLSDLIAASVVNETGSSGEDDYLPSSDCIRILAEKTTESFDKHSRTQANNLEDLFSGLSNLDLVSRRNLILLSEVIDALAANVRKHGFRPDGLRVFAGARCGDVDTIVVTYRPAHTFEDESRTQRVCISPMPSSTGIENGYSYGLFLLATQIRMSGGWITSHWEEADRFEESPFGFTVVLNADAFQAKRQQN